MQILYVNSTCTMQVCIIVYVYSRTCTLYSYRHGQNRVTDLKREGESLGIAAAGGLMLLQRDMKKGREAKITAKINTFLTVIVAIQVGILGYFVNINNNLDHVVGVCLI